MNALPNPYCIKREVLLLHSQPSAGLSQLVVLVRVSIGPFSDRLLCSDRTAEVVKFIWLKKFLVSRGADRTMLDKIVGSQVEAVEAQLAQPASAPHAGAPLRPFVNTAFRMDTSKPVTSPTSRMEPADSPSVRAKIRLVHCRCRLR